MCLPGAWCGYSWNVAGSPQRLSKPWLRVVPGGAGGARARPPTDEELIEAFERGDRDVAAHIYDRLIGVVDGTLYRVHGCREQDHEDLVQSAFEQIMLALSKRRFARACSLSSWASAVTAHVAMNALRSRRRERNVVDRTTDGDSVSVRTRSSDDVERQAGARQQLDRLRLHLAALKPEKAVAVLLHDVLGHELAEIAVLTGVSVAAAQSRLVRGRRELSARVAADPQLSRREGGT